MSEAPECLNRTYASFTFDERIGEFLTPFRIEIEKHILLAAKVVEHGHPAHVSRFGNLIDCDLVEASLGKEPCGSIGYGLTGPEPFAGAAGWHR
ncbi:hypothetical protein RvVAR031_pl06050 (plasmid) [Agrobacterium vitis]|nr:hypothetical protein RvVAR031_pl06050 [Agrobacterium vitis]